MLAAVPTANASDNSQERLGQIGFRHAHIHWARRNCSLTVSEDYTAWVLERTRGLPRAVSLGFFAGVSMGEEAAAAKAKRIGTEPLCREVRKMFPCMLRYSE